MEYRGFYIKLDQERTMYSLSNVGKGVLAKVLQGLYTTPIAAKKQIDQYLSGKNKE